MFDLRFILLEAVRPGTPSSEEWSQIAGPGGPAPALLHRESDPGNKLQPTQATVSLETRKVLAKTCIAPLWKTDVQFWEGLVASIDGQAHSHVRTGRPLRRRQDRPIGRSPG